MSPDLITLSPEVEEVLRDVARRPGSGLLRVEPRNVLRSVLEAEVLARATGAGLSAAEKHLVQVHREEVAYALRAAAYYQLVNGPDAPEFYTDRAVASRARSIPTMHEVQRAVSTAMERGPEAIDTGVRLLLLACNACGRPDGPRIGMLAGAAHRLVPTQASRIYAGVDLRHGGKKHSAISAFGAVVRTGGTTEAGASAWMQLGDLMFELGRTQEAWRAADRACWIDPTALYAHANRAICALLLGGRARCQDALLSFDELLRQDAEDAARMTARFRGLAVRLPRARRVEIQRALDSMKTRTIDSALEVFHAFAAP